MDTPASWGRASRVTQAQSSSAIDSEQVKNKTGGLRADKWEQVTQKATEAFTQWAGVISKGRLLSRGWL